MSLAVADHVSMFLPAWELANPGSLSCRLEPNEIHLWVVDLKAQEQGLMPYLTSTDRLWAERISHAGKRRWYLGGRAGMRLLLSAYVGIPGNEIRFEYGSRGKPALQDASPGGRIRFNYSLSQGKALYALSTYHEVGVDIEVLPRPIRAERVAARKLTRTECATWKTIPPFARHDAMLCCWTRKEAYGKVLGVGIRYHLDQVALFKTLESCWFGTSLAGLFPNTDTDHLADSLAGVQLQMPFSAVAALMYSDVGQPRPAIRARQLVLH